MTYYDYLDRELEKVQELCKPYGFKAYLRFDELHIDTRREGWYFVPSQDNKEIIRLMHRNASYSMMNLRKERYHKQFSRKISYEDLLEYISDHEKYRYEDSETVLLFSKLQECVS